MKLAENFNGADLRNVCTEGGMFAIRDERDYIVQVCPPPPPPPSPALLPVGGDSVMAR